MPEEIEGRGNYKVRITVADSSAPGGERSCESRGRFGICNDCFVYGTETRADLWISRVQIGAMDGRWEEHDEVDYSPDDGDQSFRVHVNVEWNGEPLPEMCELVIRGYPGGNLYSSTSRSSSAVVVDTLHTGTAHMAPTVGHHLPLGMTPGETIPYRLELFVGHEEIPARERIHLDVCERLTGNNVYDYSITLTDPASP